ncbi:hypothetical protein [Ensifer adhaerens]
MRITERPEMPVAENREAAGSPSVALTFTGAIDNARFRVFANSNGGNDRPLFTEERPPEANPRENGKVDLTALANQSGRSAEIESYFKEQMSTGKALHEALAKDKATSGTKTDPFAVIAKFAADVTAVKAFLGPKRCAC